MQNFASAAAGIAIAVALIRGFARQEKKTIGNFWVDVTRATVYVLLPISIDRRAALRLRRAWFRIFNPYTDVTTVEGARHRPSRKGRWRRRKPSSNWAPTAAASSTRTPRIRLRIRLR